MATIIYCRQTLVFVIVIGVGDVVYLFLQALSRLKVYLTYHYRIIRMRSIVSDKSHITNIGSHESINYAVFIRYITEPNEWEIASYEFAIRRMKLLQLTAFSLYNQIDL